MAGKNVLVTGAEGALGGFVCKRFLAGGYRVFGTYHPKQSAPTGEGITWIATDITDAASVKASISKIGHVDVLAHCAGGFRFANIEQNTDADLDFLLNVNLRSTFLLLRELVPGMKSRNFGRIVLISSRATLQAPGGMSAYAASKAGLNAIVAAVADEVRAHDININAVLPTVIDTPANRSAMPKSDFNTWVKPTELAEIIFSLAEPLGRPVHGALIPVSGRV